MADGSVLNAMFARIAARYDLANQVLSGGLCRWWLRRFARLVRREAPSRAVVADLATGSGDVAFALARVLPEAEINGYDFCQPMLDIALRKRAAAGAEKLRFALGDCMALPLVDDSADVVTIAYGVRNFQDRKRGLAEMLRVLRPGGSVFILEFSQPRRWFRPVYYLYLRLFLPLLARVTTGNKEAYDYLVKSIAQFPDKNTFSEELSAVGFEHVQSRSLTAGIIAIHSAKKKKKT